MYRSSGQGRLKAKTHLLVKKLLAWGEPPALGPARLGICDQASREVPFQRSPFSPAVQGPVISVTRLGLLSCNTRFGRQACPGSCLKTDALCATRRAEFWDSRQPDGDCGVAGFSQCCIYKGAGKGNGHRIRSSLLHSKRLHLPMRPRGAAEAPPKLVGPAGTSLVNTEAEL